LRIAHHLMHAGDQRVQLAHDRVSRRRPGQAATEEIKRVVPLALFDGGRA
jgi:hypothetical protein